MRITVRSKILGYIAEHPGVTAVQVAQALGLNAPAVRHHIEVLRSEERIELLGTALEGVRRGRPARRYQATDAVLGDNLAMLADEALKAWAGDADTVEERAKQVEVLGARMGAELRGQNAEHRGATRLARLVQRLDQLHYAARWEAGAQGPRLLFGRCPYAAIIERHPELCQMDAEAVGLALNVKMRQQSKIQPGRPESVCAFIMKD